MFRNVLLICLSILQISSAEEWWEEETRMDEGGKIPLTQKPWWSNVASLKTGEFLVVPSTLQNGGNMIVRRDPRTRSRSPQDMIVWIIDDDGDLPTHSSQGDTDSDCYVVDYGCDGTVDRMVDYLDIDHDQIADEMDIRYFVEGELRRAWFATDWDGDGSMWDTADYEYTGDFFRSDPYGNNEIYMNKFHPQTRSWIPISECPFDFYDTDDDRQSEAVVRCSVAPLDFSPENDPDYANSQARYDGAFLANMDRMGIMNVRYSLDLDDLSDSDHPLHYDMGVNLVGKTPYQFEGMYRTQALRRAPKTTVCIPYEQARSFAESYPADQTGFSWHEFEDASIAIGYPARPESDRRWEGVFWTWERRIMHNTGGPVQQWNIRREYNPNFSDRRQFYYNPVDRRIHLKGAREGWLHVGYIESEQKAGEIRMFDSNQDGYFDRWEYYWKEEILPYRIAELPDSVNRDLENEWSAIRDFYQKTIIPESIQWNEKLIQSLERGLGDNAPPVPDYLNKALQTDLSPAEKRYLLDWLREDRFRHFQREARIRAQKQLQSQPKQDPRLNSEFRKQSGRIWENAVLLSLVEKSYSLGEYGRVIEILDRMEQK